MESKSSERPQLIDQQAKSPLAKGTKADGKAEGLSRSAAHFPDFSSCTSHPPMFQGAEARLYLCLHEGRQGVLKQRFPKQYRHPTLDSALTKERVKAELRAAKKCQEANIPVPSIYHTDVKGAISDVVYAYVGQGLTAKQHIEEQRAQLSSAQFKAFIEDFGQKLGRILARLHHSANLIHGDLTTSNVMVDRGESHQPGDDYSLVLIDFGLSFTSQQVEDRAVDLYVFERAIKTTHSGVEKGLVEATLRAYRQSADAEVRGAIDERVVDKSAVNAPSQKTPKQIKQREQNGPDAVLRKLAEVRRRGRKRDMLG